MNAPDRSWLIPRKDDWLNFWLWRAAPWLAGFEWLAMMAMGMMTSSCGGAQDVTQAMVATGIVTLLFMAGLRATTWGGELRMGALILTVTNGFLLMALVFAIVAQWWSFKHQ